MGVPAGEHTIKITKSGYKSWERKVHTSTGAVKITAELEPIAVVTPAPTPVVVPTGVAKAGKTSKPVAVSADQQGTEPEKEILESPSPAPSEAKSPEVRPAVLSVVDHHAEFRAPKRIAL